MLDFINDHHVVLFDLSWLTRIHFVPLTTLIIRYYVVEIVNSYLPMFQHQMASLTDILS